MAKATRVHSTPPTNTPIDTTRRRFITIAAGASIVSVGSLAAVAAIPATANVTSDPAFALIAQKRAADVAHDRAIDAQAEFDDRGDHSSDAAIEAQDNSEAACHLANEVDWKLAATPPATIAGAGRVSRFVSSPRIADPA